jgi:hypothetical protein
VLYRVLLNRIASVLVVEPGGLRRFYTFRVNRCQSVSIGQYALQTAAWPRVRRLSLSRDTWMFEQCSCAPTTSELWPVARRLPSTVSRPRVADHGSAGEDDLDTEVADLGNLPLTIALISSWVCVAPPRPRPLPASVLVLIALRTSSAIGVGNPMKFAGSSRNSGFDARYAAFNWPLAPAVIVQ